MSTGMESTVVASLKYVLMRPLSAKDNPFSRSRASEMPRGIAYVCLAFMLLPLAIYAQTVTSKLV